MNRRRRLWILAPLGLAVGVGACRSADPGEAGGLGGPDRGLAASVDASVAVGGVEAPEWASFGDVTALGFDGGGRLHVLDATAKRVTVLDSTGAEAGTLGAPGEGPGELRLPSAMAVLPDGRVAVYDAGPRAFVVYGPDGTHLWTVALPDDQASPPPGTLGVLDDGRVVGSRTEAAEADSPEAGGAGAVMAHGVEPGVPSAVLATFWRPSLPDTREPGPELTGGMRVRLPPLVAFHPGLLVAARPGGGMAVVDSTDWAVDLLDGSGVVTATLRRPLEPVRVTPAIEAAERARRLEAALADPPRFLVTNAAGDGQSAAEAVVRPFVTARVEGMGFHPVVPVVVRLGVDAAGRIWVERAGERPGERGPIDVVDAAGRYLGTLPADGVRMPQAFGPDGLAAWRETDAWGAPVVRLGRIRLGGD